MTDKERVNKLNDLICGLADQGILPVEDMVKWSEIMGDPVIDIYDISVCYIENLGTQCSEMWIDHENERLEVHAHTKYVYDMTMHEITCVIDFANIVNVSSEFIAYLDRTEVSIETDDETYDFYFQNQENGFAVYQILARYLAKHN